MEQAEAGKSRAAEFLNLYSQLEDAVAQRYNIDSHDSAVGYLVRERSEFASMRSQLDYCREVRNLLAHRPKVDGTYAVEPSAQMVELMRKTLTKVANPLRARTIMVPREKVLCATLDDLVVPVMHTMKSSVFTHVPVVEDNVVVGVFTDNVLASDFLDGKPDEVLTEQSRFRDFERFLPLDRHTSESFRYCSANEQVATLSAQFRKALRSSDRIGMIFVTQNGKPTEKLLGIITAWDVAANWDD